MATIKTINPSREARKIVIQMCMLRLSIWKNQVTTIQINPPSRINDHSGDGNSVVTLSRRILRDLSRTSNSRQMSAVRALCFFSNRFKRLEIFLEFIQIHTVLNR